MSLRAPGCFPVSRTILAEPRTVWAARAWAISRGRPECAKRLVGKFVGYLLGWFIGCLFGGWLWGGWMADLRPQKEGRWKGPN